MLKHLIKLMWNKRRANGLLFLEILLAFIVLFGVYAFGFYNLDRYRSPLGFSYENSVGVYMDLADDMDSVTVLQTQERIKREVRELPGVASVTFLGQVNPFANNTWSTSNDEYGFNIRTLMMMVDEDFAETAEVDIVDGRWFTKADYQGKYEPVVINKAFKDKYFPDAVTMVDSLFPMDDTKKIVGQVGDFKYHSNFAENVPLTFFSQEEVNINDSPFQQLIVRTHPGQTAAVEEPLYNLVSGITKNSDVVIWNMAEDRVKANRPVTIPLTILTIISGFLLINIALGLFGVLFTQINRRRAEIGLRKAMGATRAEVTTQFVLEVLIVTVAGMFLGFIFAIQVPLLDLVPIPAKFFYLGIVGAVLTIVLIVVVCALIPSRQAAGLHPALVLHEE